MRYLSVFSGIEAATAAWAPLGWEAVAYAEIDKFPCAILDRHYPDVINLGDITQITDDDLRALGHIDIVVGGSPCQDLSVAGKRAGLIGERSSLFHEQMRIFHAARSICGARYLQWENVPGAFSSHTGADFAQVVGAMAGCTVNLPHGQKWQNTGCALGSNGLVEWCTLDAQWFGVPQRRKRVFALLDTGDWSGRPPILFEPESLLGNPPPSRQAQQDVAGTITARSGKCRGSGFPPEQLTVANPLTARMYKGINTTLDEGQTPIIEPIPIPIHDQATRYSGKRGDKSDGKGNGLGVGAAGEMCPTLTKGDKHAVAFNARQDPDISGDISGPLNGQSPQDQAICFQTRYARNDRGAPSNIAAPLTAEAGKTGRGDSAQCVQHGMAVRRLTPIECERLQGFPDDFTRIPYRGKPAERCPDGPRYKALGNSMAVPVMRWIGERIQNAT